MGRIRTIKPEFSHSEQIGRLSRDARLLFILLWSICDDEGRARAAPELLAGQLYPFDEDVTRARGALTEQWMSELEKQGLIRRYQVEGAKYLEVIKWSKHQKINRPSTARYPKFSEGSPIPHAVLSEGSVSEEDKEEEIGGGKRVEVAQTQKRSRATRLPAYWMPTEAGAQFAQDHGLSQAETNRELEKFTNYWTAKSGQGATKIDWDATWRNWVLTAVERRGSSNGPDRPSASERARRLADEVRAAERARGVG